MARFDGRTAAEDKPIDASEPTARDRAAHGYYPWFDWLRLGLSLVVLLGHQHLIAWPPAANFAVQVFFALSGWLIGGLLLKLPGNGLSRFYFNRALRIWCPYFLALALLVSVSLLRDPVTAKWKEFVLYKTTFVYNIFGPPQIAQHGREMPLQGTGNHFWSVNAEEQFYLLAPVLLVLAPAFGRSVITWAAIAAVAWVSKSYASIAFGVLAAVAAHTYGAFHTRYRFRVAAAILAALTAVGLAVGADYDRLAPVCAIALVLLLAISGKQHRFGEFAGGISYPLYLNAWVATYAVNFIWKRLGFGNAVVHHALLISASLAMAALLYWTFDRRVLAARERLYTAQRARLVTTVAYLTVLLGLCVGLFVYKARG
jgi:peptidoglycan/LPS O-acetylase OafA/YrhL